MIKSSKTLLRTQFSSQRNVSYSLPPIRLLDSFRCEERGLPGLYSSKAVDELWYNRGKALVDKVNIQIEKLKVENVPANLYELIQVSYSKPDLQELFTNASLLHNLQFYLESLKANESRSFAKADESALFESPSSAINVANGPSDKALASWIVDTFGSMAEFKTLLINSAASIRGDGTTWLVAQATYSQSVMHDGASTGVTFETLAVVNTYNAGIVDDSIKANQLTKLKHQKLAKIQAMERREAERKEMASEQEEDQNGTRKGEDGLEFTDEDKSAIEVPEQNLNHKDIMRAVQEVTLGSVEDAEEILFSDRKLVPLLAIDASTRAYVEDYGLYGKRHYLENVWHCIDWNAVASRAPPRYKPSMVFEY